MCVIYVDVFKAYSCRLVFHHREFFGIWNETKAVVIYKARCEFYCLPQIPT